MSERDYLDPNRFPLTTQPGLDLRWQRLIDSVNQDDLERLVEEGGALDGEQQAILEELRAKGRLREGAK